MSSLRMKYERRRRPIRFVFLHYVLPWVVLLIGSFGLYLALSWLLVAVMQISQPASMLLL